MRLKNFLLIFLAGALLGVVVMVSWPVAYLTLADGLTWRMGRVSVSQPILERSLNAIYLKQEAVQTDGGTMLFGDSHLQRLPSSQLIGVSSNFSISGETAAHLAERIVQHRALKRARRIVLLSGRNDLNYGADASVIDGAFAHILATIPTAVPISIIGIPPTAQASKRQQEQRLRTNVLLEARCVARMGCTYLSTDMFAEGAGQLAPRFDVGDGGHLNGIAYAMLIERLNAQ